MTGTADLTFANDPFLLLEPPDEFLVDEGLDSAELHLAPGGEDSVMILPPDWTEERLNGLWVSLQAGARKLAELLNDDVSPFNVEQLNLNRLSAIIDVSASWILLIADSHGELDQAFCQARLASIDQFARDLDSFLAKRG